LNGYSSVLCLSGRFFPDQVYQSAASVMRQTYRIGALNRTSFRRSLQAAGISYTEDKGFLDSQFVVDANTAQHQVIVNYINKNNYRAEFTYFTFKVKNGGEANEFEAYVKMFPDAEMTKKKGWFKTTFDIYCHPTKAKLFQNMADQLT
jgi:hypothetical protein